MVVKDVERDEIEFLSKSLGAKPISDIEAFTEDKLGYAELVEETSKDKRVVSEQWILGAWLVDILLR